MLHEFDIDLDLTCLEEGAFEDLCEQVWELGNEGASVAMSGGRVYLHAYLDYPTLSDAIIHALTYLRDKNVPVKGITAPTD
jgi:hypothetical protein